MDLWTAFALASAMREQLEKCIGSECHQASKSRTRQPQEEIHTR